MKNTTQIKEILGKLSKDQKAIEKATLELQALINAYSDTRAHPGIFNAKGNLVAKWCSKHKQYELATTFPKNTRSKDGLYSHCRYAEKRAKSYAARITKLKDAYFNASDKERKNIIKTIDQLQLVKNDYNFKDDVPDEIYQAQVEFEKQYKEQII
jgi:hypothetical protein